LTNVWDNVNLILLTCIGLIFKWYLPVFGFVRAFYSGFAFYACEVSV